VKRATISSRRAILRSPVFRFCVLLTLTVCANAQAAKPPAAKPDENSCRRFVQDFYDWYLAHGRGGGSGASIAPHGQRFFEHGLWEKLKADDAAQSHADEIVGLDFDPILNSQDPSPRFRVQTAKLTGNRCDATVVGLDQGVERERILPELGFRDGRWVFLNFHYKFEINGKLQDGDLISILNDLARDRARTMGKK